MSFPVWRELKRLPLNDSCRQKQKLTMSFPVWRELKLFWVACCSPLSRNPYNVLSRLKGIETLTISWFDGRNNIHLTMSFPVWRESKRFFSRNLKFGLTFLTMSFPVWRESKHGLGSNSLQNTTPYNVLSRLKGIETIRGLPERALCRVISYNVLSRLKGIETALFKEWPSAFCFAITCDTLSRLKGIETQFPVSTSWDNSCTLRYTFPVEMNSLLMGWRLLSGLCRLCCMMQQSINRLGEKQSVYRKLENNLTCHNSKNRKYR